MSFITILEEWIAVGESTKKELFDAIKSSLDYLNSAITELQINSKRIEICNMEVGGFINQYSASELAGVNTFVCNDASVTINNLKVILLNNYPNSSSGGNLQINVLVSKNNGVSFTSILNGGNPLILSSYATGSSAVGTFKTDGSNVISLGDIVRIDIVSKMTTQGSFQIICSGVL